MPDKSPSWCSQLIIFSFDCFSDSILRFAISFLVFLNLHGRFQKIFIVFQRFQIGQKVRQCLQTFPTPLIQTIFWKEFQEGHNFPLHSKKVYSIFGLIEIFDFIN